jgi:hypothetical protein
MSMRKIREVLRLTHELGLSVREVREATGVGKTAVSEYVIRQSPMPSSTASSTPRTALPSTARPCANHRKIPASVENLTTTPPSEPFKWSTGAAVRDHRNAVRDHRNAVRDHRNAVRDRSERCPQSIGITVRIRRNPQPSRGAEDASLLILEHFDHDFHSGTRDYELPPSC